jgi:hypothetical protein
MGLRGGQFVMQQPSMFQQFLSFLYSIPAFLLRNWCYVAAGVAVLFAVLYFVKPTQIISPVKEKMCNSCPKRERPSAFSM